MQRILALRVARWSQRTNSIEQEHTNIWCPVTNQETDQKKEGSLDAVFSHTLLTITIKILLTDAAGVIRNV